MGAPRSTDLLARRRRAHDDEGEDEAGSGAAAAAEDDSSQGSLPSELDDDADAEGSDTSDQAPPKKNGLHKPTEEPPAEGKNGVATDPAAAKPTPFAAVADTEAMLNGMKIVDDGSPVDEVDFDNAMDTAPTGAATAPAAERNETLTERRRRDHEDYKKRRDADPAFVPNRGGFFMHDQRSSSMGQNGFRTAGRGRGRGRGGFAPFSPLGPPQASNPADAPWAHDLHETVADEQKRPTDTARTNLAPQQSSKPVMLPQSQPPPNRSFSRTTQVGNIQLRVFIAGMKEPIVFSAVPVHQHTRLPHHRPPLRRDKPVRISLPENPPRYIFPAIDRSFIFIPRALRPNQQGFGRGRGRGSFGYPSGRGSVYGGSTYSPSIALSRRSSIAREIGRDGMVSPAGSVMSRNRSIAMEGGRPVVRLPPSADPTVQMPSPMHPTTFSTPPAPVVNLPMPMAYPPLQPQDPLSQESLPATLPMHQPRPQKAVSVAGIEAPASPAVLQQQQQQPPQLQPLPFHQQMPMAMNGQQMYDPNLYAQHARRPSHPSQRGTPLSQIPERAIHAQPFQPYPTYQTQHAYYPQPFAAPVYYYPPAAPVYGAGQQSPSMGAPAFVPGQQYNPYLVSPSVAPDPAAAQQGGTVAHESNGMVYYYDPAQLPGPNPDETPQYPMGYPQGPGGYMMPQQVYYPSQ